MCGRRADSSGTSRRFAHVLKAANFDPKAFVPCYGMAECALAISFAPLGEGLDAMNLDKDLMATTGEAKLVDDSSGKTERSILSFVNCGKILPSLN